MMKKQLENFLRCDALASPLKSWSTHTQNWRFYSPNITCYWRTISNVDFSHLLAFYSYFMPSWIPRVWKKNFRRILSIHHMGRPLCTLWLHILLLLSLSFRLTVKRTRNNDVDPITWAPTMPATTISPAQDATKDKRLPGLDALRPNPIFRGKILLKKNHFSPSFGESFLWRSQSQRETGQVCLRGLFASRSELATAPQNCHSAIKMPQCHH